MTSDTNSQPSPVTNLDGSFSPNYNQDLLKVAVESIYQAEVPNHGQSLLKEPLELIPIPIFDEFEMNRLLDICGPQEPTEEGPGPIMPPQGPNIEINYFEVVQAQGEIVPQMEAHGGAVARINRNWEMKTGDGPSRGNIASINRNWGIKTADSAPSAPNLKKFEQRVEMDSGMVPRRRPREIIENLQHHGAPPQVEFRAANPVNPVQSWFQAVVSWINHLDPLFRMCFIFMIFAIMIFITS
jgi:hypothetical protein